MKKKFTMLFAALLAFAGVAKADVTLPNANNSYTVVAEGHNSGAKPGWAINNDGTKMVSFGNTAIADEAQKEFAFVQNDGKVYLYSVWAKKFVNKSMSLTDALPIDPITVENVDGGKYFFKYDDSHIMNIGGSKQLAPDTWSAKDGGNQYTLTVVTEGIDLTAALAILNNSAKVTYQYVYGEEVKFEETIETVPGGEYPDYNMTFPFGVVAAAKPEGQVSNDETVQIELSINLPFAYAENYDAVEAGQYWYYLVFDSSNKFYLHHDAGQNHIDLNSKAVDKENKDIYSWGFVGNPFDGFQVVNRGAGSKMILSSSTTMSGTTGADTWPIMTTTPVPEGNNSEWVLTNSPNATNGFYMEQKGYSSNKMNNRGKLAYWTGGAGTGSTFVVEARPFGPVAELEALIEEANALQSTVNGNIGTKIGEYTQATADALTAAIKTADDLVKAETATANDVATLQAAMDAVKVILPTAGQYYQIHSSLTKFAAEQGEGTVKALYSNGTEPRWKTLNDDDKSFYWKAVAAEGGNVVLQNAANGKYLVGNAGRSGAWSMADTPTAASYISVKIFNKENANGYEYGVIMNNWQMHCNGHGEGKSNEGNIVSWNTDAANSASSWYIVETQLKEFFDITYNFVYDEDVKYSYTTSVAKDAAYPAVVVPALPYGVTASATTPEGTVTEVKAFNFELTVEHELPFVAAADVISINTWYYAQMHANAAVTAYVEDNENEGNNVEWADKTVAADEIDSHLWGFVGDVWSGIKMVNKGTGRAIVSTSGAAVMGDAANATAFIPVYSDGAYRDGWFCLKYPTNNDHLNASGDKINAWWDDDNGSSFKLTSYQEKTVTISEVDYSTLYLGYATYIPEGVEVYAVSSIENGYVALEAVEGVLPANTGVIIKNAGEYTFKAAGATGDATSLLQGSTTDTYVAGNAYVLAAKEGVVGLYKAILNKNENGEVGTTHFKNNAFKAYLPVAEDEEAPAMFTLGRGGDDESTGIDQLINNGEVVIYDLAGRRVEKMEKGIYIVNGKKVIR